MSKLSKPVASVDALTGRKSYGGSITSMGGGTFDKKAQRAIMKALRAGPKYPSGIVVEGVSPYSIHGQQGLHLFLQSLDTAGLAKFDRKAGWILTDKGVEHLDSLEGKDE